MLIVNPKRENENVEGKPYWYNYYAGYSHTFTQGIIESVRLNNDAVLLDPWNGTGTSTLMAALSGVSSIGVDLNPVMKVIASAKQTFHRDADEIRNSVKSITSRCNVTVADNDHLLVWFDFKTVQAIRKIEFAIIGKNKFENIFEKANSLTNSQCLMYTALFNCVRSYLTDFIPSNPTWVKKPKNRGVISISWRDLKRHFIHQINEMLDGLCDNESAGPMRLAEIKIGTSTNLPLEEQSVDFVLTSPPYCTRIDYGIATLPELSILSVGGETEIDHIRRGLMGTTTVPEVIDNSVNDLTDKCLSFLSAVKNHPSKASETYYFKNLAQYFLSLNKSIFEINRVLKPNSFFVCVVQDSYYKDVHCNLPAIITEMVQRFGIELRDCIEFESKRNMANLNVNSKKYRSKSLAYESVLVFKKGD